jgi:hypothetical protein
MAAPPVSLWSVGDHECVMCVVEGRRELSLRVGGRTVRLQTVGDEAAARRLADEWRKELPPRAVTEA